MVRLAIKPATLNIVGDGNMSYQISGHPEVVGRVGANSVAMRSEYEGVTVTQIESSKAVTVRLFAGHGVEASFLPGAALAAGVPAADAGL